jgi:DNA-binding transcriptional ArsR family regulator
MLSDSTRVKIIKTVIDRGSVNVTDLCEAVGIAQPNMSITLAKLRDLEILEDSRDGTSKIYSMAQDSPRAELAASFLEFLDDETAKPVKAKKKAAATV